MKNDLFTIGPFTVHGYGLMIAVGVLAAVFVAEYRAKKKGLDAEQMFSLEIWCLIGGILGAKILYYITEIKDIISNPKLLLDFGGGFVVFGGIIGGIFTGFLFCKVKKLPFLKYFDLVMPSIALAQGFGRIGCLLAGCCYGLETDCAFSIVFKNSQFAPNGVHLIPTEPISSALDFLHFFVLVFLAKRVKADGQVAGFYLIFYSAGRFVIEFFRGDLIRGTVGMLTTSQFISTFTFIAGIVIVFVCGKRGKQEIME